MSISEEPDTSVRGIPGLDISTIPPTGTDFIDLRRQVGLTPPPVSPAIAGEALAHSVLVLVARIKSVDSTHDVHNDTPIGMVRLIGDGHIFLTVTDMCVLPAYQGRGLGSRLLDEALAWIDKNAPNAYVMMIADPPGQKMYRKKGFQVPAGIGMARASWGKMADTT